jgi:hypothetical protein
MEIAIRSPGERLQERLPFPLLSLYSFHELRHTIHKHQKESKHQRHAATLELYVRGEPSQRREGKPNQNTGHQKPQTNLPRRARLSGSGDGDLRCGERRRPRPPPSPGLALVFLSAGPAPSPRRSGRDNPIGGGSGGRSSGERSATAGGLLPVPESPAPPLRRSARRSGRHDDPSVGGGGSCGSRSSGERSSTAGGGGDPEEGELRAGETSTYTMGNWEWR